MNRSALKKVPGRLLFDSVSLFSKLNTNIQSQLVRETFEVGTDPHGVSDVRDKEAYWRVTITPEGRLTSGIAAVLWPYGNPTIGSGIFTDTDKPLAIHGNDSSLDTFTAAALESMPSLKFSSVDTAIGQATFLCLRGNADEWTTANSLLTQADTGGTATDATFDPADIITQPYFATWGAVTGFADMDTEDGFNVEFTVNLSDGGTDALGLVNKYITSVTAMVRCIPIGPTRQQLLTNAKIQDTGASRGRSHTSGGADLTITGEDTTDYFVLKNASLTTQVLRHGSNILRVGEVAWMANRAFTTGVPGALFQVLPS